MCWKAQSKVMNVWKKFIIHGFLNKISYVPKWINIDMCIFSSLILVYIIIAKNMPILLSTYGIWTMPWKATTKTFKLVWTICIWNGGMSINHKLEDSLQIPNLKITILRKQFHEGRIIDHIFAVGGCNKIGTYPITRL